MYSNNHWVNLGELIDPEEPHFGEFSGIINEILIWDKEDQNQIQSSMSSTISGKNGLVGYWNLNEWLNQFY